MWCGCHTCQRYWAIHTYTVSEGRLTCQQVKERAERASLLSKEILEQAESSSVDCDRGDDVVPGVAETEDRRRDGSHPTAAAVGGLCAFEGSQLPAQGSDSGVERAAVQVVTCMQAGRQVVSWLGS